MPLYEYDCVNCGIFEAVHGMLEDLKECPACGLKVTKCISSGIRIGWVPNYYDVTLGRQITSLEQRKQLMKARGLADGAPDHSPRIKNQKKAQADQLGISVSELEHHFEKQWKEVERLEKDQKKEVS